MKPFDDSSKLAVATRREPGKKRSAIQPPAADRCAGLLLETVPQIMRAMRLAIGGLEPPALTVPQFRTLHFVQTHSGANLSVTADFLGLTLPSTSKLVDQLVRRGVLARNSDTIDRRRMTLRLTARGDALLKGAQVSVRHRLAETLNRFGTAELVALQNALGLLQESFPPPPPFSQAGSNGHHVTEVSAGGNDTGNENGSMPPVRRFSDAEGKR